MRRKSFKKRKKIKKPDIKAYENAVLSWDAYEFLHIQKGKLWNIFALAAVIITAAIGFVLDAWSFSLAIMAFAVAYYFVHKEEPKVVTVKISDIGIKAGNRYYPYNKIKAFWILHEPPFVNKLVIRVHGDLLRDVNIQLANQDPSLVRELLTQKIPELKGQKEPLSEVFIRLFKI